MSDLPSRAEVTVATNALRREADIWDDQRDVLDKLSTKVAAMEFGRLEAGLFQMMVGPYNDVIHAVAARTREGSNAMNGIADTLRSVADTYDAEDLSNEHRIRNLY